MSSIINAAKAFDALAQIKVARSLKGDASLMAGSMIPTALKACGVRTEEELNEFIRNYDGLPPWCTADDNQAFHFGDQSYKGKEKAMTDEWTKEAMKKLEEDRAMEEALERAAEEYSSKKGATEADHEAIKARCLGVTIDKPEVVIPDNNKPKEAVAMKKKSDNKHHHHKKDVGFRPMIGGVQLQPQTEPVYGLHVIPEFDAKGEFKTTRGQMRNIEVAKTSAFRNIPGLQYVTIDSTDVEIKALCLVDYLRKVNQKDKADGKPEDEWRIAAGNIKKSDCVMGVLPKKDWDAFFGCDVRALNLWKVILPIMTPTSVVIMPEYSSITSMRFRIINSLVTEGGYPEHDGDVVTKVWHEFYRHSDLEEDGVTPKPGAKPKRINRNWQLRASGRDVAGKIMPAIKAKVYADDKKYLKMCERFGFDPDGQDAFITKDNLKTLKWQYKHGDILDVPIGCLRNVKNKMKDWSSSMGAQCVANSDNKLTRDVLNGHGIVAKASTVKGASELKLHDVITVMESDQEASWDDSIGMPIKCMYSRFVGGQWYAPRMMKDQFYIRVESFYRDHAIKVQIDKDGYYLQGEDTLDLLEGAEEKETGKLQYYVLLPKTAKFIGKLVIGDKISLGRDPNVGPSNFMTFKVAGFNDSHDAFVLSWQSIYAMYGDVDGDTAKYETLITGVSDSEFPCIRRAAPGLGKEKPYPTEFKRMAAYLYEHEGVGLSVLKSAADTGSLDLTTRQIIEERMYAGLPMSNGEKMELSEIRQLAIEGLKHTDSGVGDDAKSDIIARYGVNGKMAKTKDSPLTYRLLRKDAGRSKLNEVKRFEERIRLMNEAQPHADHPYYDFFLELKGTRTIEKGSDVADSEWLFNACNNILNEIKDNHKRGNVYKFRLSDVLTLGNWINGHYKSEVQKYLVFTEEIRKKAFTDLKDHIRSVVKQKCLELFGNDTSHPAIQYQRQLTIFLGTKGFGRGVKVEFTREGDENYVTYGKTGGAMWNMVEEHTLFLAELIQTKAVARGEFPSLNPYMEKIKAALVRNREKAALKAASN